MHNTQRHGFQITYRWFLWMLCLTCTCHSSHTLASTVLLQWAHFLKAQVIKTARSRSFLKQPVCFWSFSYVFHTLSWLKKLFHYLLSVNIGIILGLTVSKSMWYFFHLASLNLLFWLNFANGKPSPTLQGHWVPVNIIKIVLETPHIAFFILAEAYCYEIQSFSGVTF